MLFGGNPLVKSWSEAPKGRSITATEWRKEDEQGKVGKVGKQIKTNTPSTQGQTNQEMRASVD